MHRFKSLKMEISLHSALLAAALSVIFGVAAAWRYQAHEDLEVAVAAQQDLARIDAIQDRARWVSRAATAGVASMSLLLVALSAVRLERRIAVPLARLEREVARMRVDSNEAFSFEFTEGPEEVRRLRDAFLQMTARVRLQHSAIAHLSDMRRRVVSMMGHEFGNVMTGLLGGLTLLDQISNITPEERGRFIRMVRENAKSLRRMSEEFIGLVQSQAGVFNFPIATIAVGPLLGRSIEALAYKCAQRGVRIEAAIPGEEIVVRGNAAVLGFALNNLIGNAVKYSRVNGVVSVSAVPGEGKVRIEVSDSGIGMSEQDLCQALEGGFRSAEAQRMSSGFGIGLSLVRDAIAGHGAELRGESRPGKGSRFWFELPAANAAKESVG